VKINLRMRCGRNVQCGRKRVAGAACSLISVYT